jgi:hypothetical protein
MCVELSIRADHHNGPSAAIQDGFVLHTALHSNLELPKELIPGLLTDFGRGDLRLPFCALQFNIPIGNERRFRSLCAACAAPCRLNPAAI